MRKGKKQSFLLVGHTNIKAPSLVAPLGPRGDNEVSGEHGQNFSSSLEHPCHWKGAKEGALRFLPQTPDTAGTSSAYACKLHKTAVLLYNRVKILPT